MLIASLLLLLSHLAISQIGASIINPDPSSEIELYSLSKGVLIPRLSLTSNLYNSTPVNSAAEGLLIYNSGINQEAGFYYWTGSYWSLLKSSSGNEISGPSSSTDNAIVRFDGTTGKIIQNSIPLLDDLANITLTNNITIQGFTLITNPSPGKILVSDNLGNGTWQSAPPIDVEQNHSLVTANVNQLNFEGGCNVFENSDIKATVRCYINNVTKDVIQLSSSDSINLNGLVTPTPIPWDIEQNMDHSSFIHSNTTNTSQIKVKIKGIYEVNYMFSLINRTIMRKTIRAQFLKNSTDFIPYVNSYSFSYNMADDKISHISSSFLIELEANDYIELVTNGQTNPGNANLIPYENVFFMRLIREL